MFVELMPLLTARTVLITVAKLDVTTLRVNVIPHGNVDDNAVLSTPLTYTGSPEELDAELGKHLAGYAKSTSKLPVPWVKPKPPWRLLPKQLRRRQSAKQMNVRRHP